MTDTAALDRPAEASAVVAAPPSGPLADLILVRLLAPRKKALTAGEIQKAVAEFFGKPPTVQSVRETLDALRTARLVSSLVNTLTDAGRGHALRYLGISGLPANAKWKTVRAKLVPVALGLSEKAVGDADKLAAVLLKRKLGLPAGTGDTLASVLDAIACRLLGYPDRAKVDFRSAILSRDIGETKPLSTSDLKKAVPARLLSPPGKGRDGLQRLALSGFADATDRHSARQSEPPADQAFDLEDFANTVLSAARESPTGRFGDNKVFISHVWRQLRDEPRFRRLGLDGFKARLVEANRADHLTLSRADLVQVMGPDDVRESETAYLNATFHFILIDKE